MFVSTNEKDYTFNLEPCCSTISFSSWLSMGL